MSSNSSFKKSQMFFDREESEVKETDIPHSDNTGGQTDTAIQGKEHGDVYNNSVVNDTEIMNKTSSDLNNNKDDEGATINDDLLHDNENNTPEHEHNSSRDAEKTSDKQNQGSEAKNESGGFDEQKNFHNTHDTDTTNSGKPTPDTFQADAIEVPRTEAVPVSATSDKREPDQLQDEFDQDNGSKPNFSETFQPITQALNEQEENGTEAKNESGGFDEQKISHNAHDTDTTNNGKPTPDTVQADAIKVPRTEDVPVSATSDKREPDQLQDEFDQDNGSTPKFSETFQPIIQALKEHEENETEAKNESGGFDEQKISHNAHDTDTTNNGKPTPDTVQTDTIEVPRTEAVPVSAMSDKREPDKLQDEFDQENGTKPNFSETFQPITKIVNEQEENETEAKNDSGGFDEQKLSHNAHDTDTTNNGKPTPDTVQTDAIEVPRAEAVSVSATSDKREPDKLQDEFDQDKGSKPKFSETFQPITQALKEQEENDNPHHNIDDNAEMKSQIIEKDHKEPTKTDDLSTPTDNEKQEKLLKSETSEELLANKDSLGETTPRVVSPLLRNGGYSPSQEKYTPYTNNSITLSRQQDNSQDTETDNNNFLKPEEAENFPIKDQQNNATSYGNDQGDTNSELSQILKQTSLEGVVDKSTKRQETSESLKKPIGDVSHELTRGEENEKQSANQSTQRESDTKEETNNKTIVGASHVGSKRITIDHHKETPKMEETELKEKCISKEVKQGNEAADSILHLSNLIEDRENQHSDSRPKLKEEALLKEADKQVKDCNDFLVYKNDTGNEDENVTREENNLTNRETGGKCNTEEKVRAFADKVTEDQMPDIDRYTDSDKGIENHGSTTDKHTSSVEETVDLDNIHDQVKEDNQSKEAEILPAENIAISANNAVKTDLKAEIDEFINSGNKSPDKSSNNHESESNIQDTNVETIQRAQSIPMEDSRNNGSTYDNMFFTGRLPSLLSRHDSSQSLSNTGHKTDKEEVIVEEPDQASKTDIPRIHKEMNEKSDDIRENQTRQNLDQSNSTFATEDLSNSRRTPTPSKNIRNLLQDMNEPVNNIYKLSRETPLTPRSTKRRSKSATISYLTINTTSDPISEVQKENLPPSTEEDSKNVENANMTVEDITLVTRKVLSTTHAEEHRSKFDDMPHMKQISDYVKENLKNTESSLKTEEAETKTKDTTVSPSKNDANDVSAKQNQDSENTFNENSDGDTFTKTTIHPILPQSLSKYSSIKFINSPDNIESDLRHSDLSQTRSPQVSETHQDKPVPRSSSENDLRAIIASAKIAISNGTTTTESHIGFETSNTSDLTLQGDNMSLFRRNTQSKTFASQKEGWGTPIQSDQQEVLASLICSNCLQVDSNVHTAGYCTTCQQYLCDTCITVHTVDNDTRLHEIVPSYCKNELTINKYVPATGYCLDCSMFLCARCAVQHTGFRSNRHHRITQSSFVSKPSNRKADTKEFLDDIQDKMGLDDSKTSSKGSKEHKRKRKLLADLDNSSPYSFPYSQVPESLYPGPKKKLASSYAKNPKWVHSSIPNLPYLVQPKPIPNKVFHAAGHSRPRMIYTRPKMGVDAMAVKLKLLKSRYKLKDEPRTQRRREQAVFTARPAKAREDFSLPDIQSVTSHTSGGRSLKHTVDHNSSSELKVVEFINEHCLSIPFPRGEKRADISAMTVLLNGKLVILDKNNNNIKLYNKGFHCTAALQFQNRLVDVCASNLCQTDVYAATSKHIYEISVIKGLELTRKIKVEIKRIEGLTYWKYGLAIISKKTNITWELRLLDYRGNLKSKLEIFNPMTLDIGGSALQHVTSSRGGKFISVSDSKNACIITVDVTTRVVAHETMLEEGKCPTYLTSDGDAGHNLYVTCDNKVFQISRKGKVVGVLIDKAKENGDIWSIVYNRHNDRLYVKTGKDTISVYQVYF